MLASRTILRDLGALMNVPTVAASPEDFFALLEDGAFYAFEQCSISVLMPFFDTGYKSEGPSDFVEPLTLGYACKIPGTSWCSRTSHHLLLP